MADFLSRFPNPDFGTSWGTEHSDWQRGHSSSLGDLFKARVPHTIRLMIIRTADNQHHFVWQPGSTAPNRIEFKLHSIARQHHYSTLELGVSVFYQYNHAIQTDATPFVHLTSRVLKERIKSTPVQSSTAVQETKWANTSISDVPTEDLHQLCQTLSKSSGATLIEAKLNHLKPHGHRMFPPLRYCEEVDMELRQPQECLASPQEKSIIFLTDDWSDAFDILNRHFDEETERGVSKLQEYYQQLLSREPNKESSDEDDQPDDPILSEFTMMSYHDRFEYCLVQAVGMHIAEAKAVNNANDTLETSISILQLAKNNRKAFLGFVERERLSSLNRFSVHDTLDLKFLGNSHRGIKEGYRARVITPLANTPIESSTLLIVYRRNKDPALDFENATIPPDLKDSMSIALEKLPRREVSLSYHHPSLPFERTMSSLQRLQQHGHPHVWQLLLASHLDDLPVINLFETLGENLYPAIGHMLSKLNDDQKRLIYECQRAKAGLVLSHGPGGSGKSFCFRMIVQMMLSYPSKHVGLAWHSSGPSAPTVDKKSRTSPDDLESDIESTAWKLSKYSDVPKQPNLPDNMGTMANGAKDTQIHSSDCGNPGSPQKNQVAIFTNDNAAADNICAELIQDNCQNGPSKQRPIIIRFHAWATELRRLLRDDVSGPKTSVEANTREAIRAALAQNISDTVQADIAKQVQESTTFPTRDVPDMRMQLEYASLAIWMLIACGLVGERDAQQLCDHRITNKKRFSRVREQILEYTTGKIQADDSTERNSFAQNLIELRDYVLSEADVICTTLFNSGDAMIYNNFRPVLVLVDEATRARESTTLPLFVNYPYTRGWIMAGDMFQLGPHEPRYPRKPKKPREPGDPQQFRNPREPERPNEPMNPPMNVFHREICYSFFSRMVQAGFPTVHFHKQVRFNSEINTLTNAIAYEDVESDPSADQRVNVEAVKAFSRSHLGLKKPSSCVLVDIPSAECDKTTDGSKHNLISSFVGLKLLASLRQHFADEITIGIVTPYQLQVEMYQQGINVVKRVRPEKKWDNISFWTIDKAQGREFDIVIFDVVVDERPGFVNRNRFITGLTRVRDGLILLANATELKRMGRSFYWVDEEEDDDYDESRHFRVMVKNCESYGRVVVDRQAKNDKTATDFAENLIMKARKMASVYKEDSEKGTKSAAPMSERGFHNVVDKMLADIGI